MTNRAMPLEPVEVGCCTCSKGRATKVGGDQDRLHIICVLSYMCYGFVWCPMFEPPPLTTNHPPLFVAAARSCAGSSPGIEILLEFSSSGLFGRNFSRFCLILFDVCCPDKTGF